MHAFLIVMALTAAQVNRDVGVEREARDEVPRAVLWPTVSASTRFDEGATGAAQLALSYRVADWLAPELLASFGGYAAPPTSAGVVPRVELVDRFSIGTRLIAPFAELDGIEPFVWVALHHEHQTQLAAIERQPIAATFGLSSAGVVHKTGAEVAVGVALPIDVDRTRTFASGRVGVAALPSFGAAGQHDELALFVDVGAGLPLRL